MRNKYRSAVYTFEEGQEPIANRAINLLQKEFAKKIITMVIPFKTFKLNGEHYLNYYYKDPAKPFCKNMVNPKLKDLLNRFPELVNQTRLAHL